MLSLENICGCVEVADCGAGRECAVAVAVAVVAMCVCVRVC